MNSKMMYSILKEISEGNGPRYMDYEMDEYEFSDMIRYLQAEGFIRNITYTKDRIIFGSFPVTQKGMEYLSQNSVLGKTYRGLKEIKSWLTV